MQEIKIEKWKIIIVFITASILTIGGLSLYPYLRKQYEFHKIVRQIQSLTENIMTYKTTRPNYMGLDNTYLINNNLLPENTITYQDTSKIFSLHGGAFSITSATTHTKNINNEGFAISYHDLSKEMCIQIATYDWRKIKKAEFLGLSASHFTIEGDDSTIVKGCDGHYNPKGLLQACVNGSNVGIPAPEEQAEVVCQCYIGLTCSVILKFE